MSVKITRMELLRLKRLRQLAQRARDLLEEKRTVLIMEFLSLVSDFRRISHKLDELLKTAYDAIALAEVYMGKSALTGISPGLVNRFTVDVETRTVMGITIYRLRLKKMMEFKDVIQYSFLSSSSILDEALMSMEEALGLMVELGGLEVSIKALADELRKIKRRVNVLERVILPRLDEEIRFIEYRLDEMEREAQFRIRRLLQMKV